MTPPPPSRRSIRKRSKRGSMPARRYALVDVRETWECSLAHIPGSINFPLGELADCVMELDAEDEIIVCCHHGARNYEGAQILIESGFPCVASVIGGIDAWSCLVDPSIPRYREGG